MVKFSREYEASIIPEWKAAFVDYKSLKKLIKKIKIARRDDPAHESAALSEDDELVAGGGGSFSVLDPVSALAAWFAPSLQTFLEDEESSYSSGELVRPMDTHEREFLERADEELEKVNTFYTQQEAELLGRGEAFIDQLRILADVKRILADQAASRRARGLLGRRRSMQVSPAPVPPEPVSPAPLSPYLSSPLRRRSVLASRQSMSHGSVELQQAQMTESAAPERNGVSLGNKARVGTLQLPSTVRIDIPAASPGRTALKVWEELVKVLPKDGADPAATFVHRKKIQHAEKNIRDAFMALYRGLELLKKFRHSPRF